jgi:hypothetical protein
MYQYNISVGMILKKNNFIYKLFKLLNVTIITRMENIQTLSAGPQMDKNFK